MGLGITSQWRPLLHICMTRDTKEPAILLVSEVYSTHSINCVLRHVNLTKLGSILSVGRNIRLDGGRLCILIESAGSGPQRFGGALRSIIIARGLIFFQPSNRGFNLLNATLQASKVATAPNENHPDPDTSDRGEIPFLSSQIRRGSHILVLALAAQVLALGAGAASVTLHAVSPRPVFCRDLRIPTRDFRWRHELQANCERRRFCGGSEDPVMANRVTGRYRSCADPGKSGVWAFDFVEIVDSPASYPRYVLRTPERSEPAVIPAEIACRVQFHSIQGAIGSEHDIMEGGGAWGCQLGLVVRSKQVPYCTTVHICHGIFGLVLT